MAEDYCMYLRKSRADLDAEARGEGETLARHRGMLEALAQRQGLSVVRVYQEIVSGDSISARPQMQLLLSDLAAGRYAGVLVAEIERLARGDTIDQGIVAQAFRDSGTKIITPMKTYDPSNEFDEEYFEFSLFMSRREYKTIRRRMQAGRLAAVREGNYICSRTPYGYRRVSPSPKVHTLAPDPAEAEAVRMMYALSAAGKGAKAIAAQLNRLGIPPQKSALWESASVRKILLNPLYCGKLCWKPRGGAPVLCEGLHPPLVTQEVFDTVQQKRAHRSAPPLPRDKPLCNHYHGLLCCAHCGHQMKRRFVAQTGQAHLLCVSPLCRGKTVSAAMTRVDEGVLTALYYFLAGLCPLVREGAPQTDTTAADLQKPLAAALEKAAQQRGRLRDLLEQGVYDVPTYRERDALLAERIAALEAELAALCDVPARLSESPAKTVQLSAVLDGFSAADASAKNALLRSVIKRIAYTKTKRGKQDDLTLEVEFF